MKLKLIYLLPILFVSLGTFGQQKTTIDYPSNVDAPLSKVEKAMINEVYQSKANQEVFNNIEFLKDIKHLLRNRILIYEENNPKAQKKTTLLSEVPLFNDYNKNLKRDERFNISEFNPLKYKLDFFANGTYLYRVDNTNYFIQITSQHRTFKK